MIATEVGREAAAYAEGWAGQPDSWQLAAFNRQWRQISIHVPYWAALREQRRLPEQFDSWEQVRSDLPVLERSDLQTRQRELCDRRHPPYQWRATGGSTGQPVRIPIWRGEVRCAAADMWHARSWFRISPSDRVFMIWGHSHLLGSGVLGWVRGRVRACKDRLLGYCRWSAYRIGDGDLREAAGRLLAFRPHWVLGYSVALERFASVNSDMANDLAALRLKAVIATGESFAHPDSQQRIAQVLGCPVVMEYGAVETGPIAHQAPEGVYRVFWRRHFVEAIPSDALPGACELVLTSLYPRCVPLIRYRIGDLAIPLAEPASSPLLTFRTVLGRCNDTIVLPRGRQIHSEAMAHVVRDSPVTGYQLVQRAGREFALRYTSAEPLTDHQLAEIRRRLERIEPSLGCIAIERTQTLEQTIAGKTKVVCRVR